MPGKIDLNKNKAIGILALALVAAAVVYLSKSPSAEPRSTATDVKQACADDNLAKEKCYAKEMSKLAQSNGPEFAFSVLFDLQKIDSHALGCHFISHGIGEGTYKGSPADWQKSLQTINPTCNYGAMHGILENYVATLPGGALTPQVAASLCGDSPRGDCNHSVGHLLLVESSADTDQALGFCQVFEDRQRENCFTGVFMEYQTALNLIAHGLAPESWLDWKSRIKELESMCRKYNDAEATACWREISHAADVAFDHEPKKIFDFCESAQVDNGKKECRNHAVAILATHARFNMEKLKSMCELPQASEPTFAEDCYVTLGITNLNQAADSFQKVRDYCLSIPSQYQESCLNKTSSIQRQNQPILD